VNLQSRHVCPGTDSRHLYAANQACFKRQPNIESSVVGVMSSKALTTEELGVLVGLMSAIQDNQDVEAKTQILATKDVHTMVKNFNPQTRQNKNRWDDDNDPLWLISLDELRALPKDTMLYSLSGSQMLSTILQDLLAMDSSDGRLDTRFGCLAYGLRESQFQATSKSSTVSTSASSGTGP
jgi:hypothetical protein